MRVLVTGARGFIGKNLVVRLREQAETEVVEFTRSDPIESLPSLLKGVDAVIHLAGENRPANPAEFVRGNAELTEQLCQAIRQTAREICLIVSSSTQAELDNPYGRSKLLSERAVERFASETGNRVAIYRLPNVFGKWCRPQYNSVVATFCHNLARGAPIRIDNPQTRLRLVYVDDVVDSFLECLKTPFQGCEHKTVIPEYSIFLGELADQIKAFEHCRDTLVSERVGTGLIRALYATYVSYLPTERFVYDLPKYGDQRGVFVEMLKTQDSGQFSFFTAFPGITRGGHYHHTKTEKFLVIKGTARFGFRHILTGERHELTTSGERPQVVETIPGWTHDITNVGSEEMLVMLWANEIFDRARPDTVACKV